MPASVAVDPTCRQGVLAFGDSITNAGGDLQWGVALQSWAMWMARCLGLGYSGYAVDGARASDVIGAQIPAFLSRSAWPDGIYDVGCLYIGVNDVREFDWDPDAFAASCQTALAFLRERCVRALAVTAPLALGVPPAGPKVAQLNAIVRRCSGEVGALVVDLSDFRARNFVMADRVHPTAFGQIAIAERALAVLAADGLAASVMPASLIRFEMTWRGRLRGDATYAYRSAKEHGRAWRLRLRSGRQAALGRAAARC